MLSKNHELCPGSMVAVVANLKSGGVHKLLKELCKQKLVTYERGAKCKLQDFTSSTNDIVTPMFSIYRRWFSADQYGI